VRFNLANALVRLERYAEARALLETPRPARADLLALLGVALRGEGRAADAVPVLRDASQRAPRDVGILNNYGVVLAETGDVPAALDVWRRVLALDPANTVARDNLAARGGR
jgi:Flp pilus assembly protein TadD